jgi:hypothetical protein
MENIIAEPGVGNLPTMTLAEAIAKVQEAYTPVPLTEELSNNDGTTDSDRGTGGALAE